MRSQIAPLLAMSSSGTGTQTAGAQMACKTVAWFRIRLNLIGYTTVNPTVVLLARPGCPAHEYYEGDGHAVVRPGHRYCAREPPRRARVQTETLA